MSSPRGRALIISNSSSNTRVGSEVDFRNVKDMLSKHFCLVRLLYNPLFYVSLYKEEIYIINNLHALCG